MLALKEFRYFELSAEDISLLVWKPVGYGSSSWKIHLKMEVKNLLQSESSVDNRDKSTRRQTFIVPPRVMYAVPDITLIPVASSAQIAQFFGTLRGEPATCLTPASNKIAI